jgi:hypothetical protein
MGGDLYQLGAATWMATHALPVFSRLLPDADPVQVGQVRLAASRSGTGSTPC